MGGTVISRCQIKLELFQTTSLSIVKYFPRN